MNAESLIERIRESKAPCVEKHKKYQEQYEALEAWVAAGGDRDEVCTVLFRLRRRMRKLKIEITSFDEDIEEIRERVAWGILAP